MGRKLMSVSTILTSKRTISAIACSLSLAAMAATPVAVWDGDFTTLTKGTFTLSENGNTKTDSYLQISGDNGITVTSTDALNVFTVIMRCSGLDLAAENAQVLFTSYVSDSQANLTGYYLLSGNSNTKGIWDGVDWSGESGATKNPVPANYTTLIYNHQQTNGTYGYALGPTSSEDDTVVRTTLYSVVGLRSSGSTYKGFSIGGLRGTTSTTLLPATGLKITSLAVFSGTLTEDEMKGYKFFSELPQVTEDTTVSALNTRFSGETTLELGVASGVTITMDAAFAASSVKLRSMGNVRLAADVQPSTEELAKLDLTGVQGGLLRSWLTPGVAGFNFTSEYGTDVSGALATTDNWIHDNNSASGTSTAMFADGLSTLKWSSANTWACSGSTIISGYLDDGANGGNGATVTLSNVPYETYDVIVYCSSDTANGDFLAKTVNGTTYTWDSTVGAVVVGNSTWGKAALSTPVYGVNALRIKNLSGPLTIYGLAKNGNSRGGIAAIEIMPPNTPDNIRTYTLTLSGAATTWSAGTWTLNGQTVEAPASGYVEIVASASTTLTVDQAVSLAELNVRGDTNIVINVATNDTGSLYAIKATVESGVFQQGSPAVLGATPSIVVASGATFDVNGMAVNEANAFTIAGAGAGSWPWALTSSGGEFPTGTLRGFTLTGDATIGGANKIGCGKSGAASYLGFSTYTLTKIGGGELSFTNIRSATGSTGTFDIAGGSVTLNEYTNLDGSNADGDPWAKTEVIVRGEASLVSKIGRWVWVGSLALDGGSATTESSYIAMQDGFAGSGTLDRVVFKGGAIALLTGNLDVTSEMVLNGNMSFVKDQTAASDVVVTPASLTASSGTITVGSGVTFNVGTSRPTATITVAQGGSLAAQLQSTSDVIALSTSAQPANVILYDANGDVVSNPSISYSDGTLTIMPHVPTLEATGTVAFDTASNWNDSAMPSENGEAIIQLAGDAAITISGTYTLGSLTITGSGVVTFSGEGTITAANISVKNGATFTRNANISATTGIATDAGTVLKLDTVTENAEISGAGAVETYGAVTFNASNTFTGGLTVKSGSEANTIKTGIGGQAYGKNNYGQAIANLSRIVVEDGGSLDLANTADACYAITISGKGVCDAQSGVYKGALYNSGSDIGQNSRQTASLTLAADAMVKAESSNNGWGIVNSGHAASVLALNGHTLTVSGAGYFPIVNANTASGTQTTGTLIADGVTLGLVGNADKACNLTGVNIVAKGCATINLATAPTALGSLTLKPSATGTTASSWNLPSGFVPAVDTSNIDAANLTVGQELTLFTAPSATELTAETIAAKAGGRYTTTISGNTVTATVKSLANFMHYDFNAANSIASDSTYNFGNLNSTFVNGKNGKAGVFDSSYKPYYGSNTSNKSPFYAGEMTVTSLLKVKEANNTILWNFGSGWDVGMALIAKDSSTISVVSWTGGAAGSDVVSVAGIADLMNKWHLVTIVANANGTTLYVDGTSATVGTVLPATIDGKGQFGSIHGTAKNYNAVSGDGFLLDDWRVYDAALTTKEVKALKRELNPDPLFIRLR